jgi:hypothetical protein
MAKTFEAACQRCKNCAREDEVERDGGAVVPNAEQDEHLAGECLEDEVEARASTCEESLVDSTTSLQLNDEEQKPPPQEPITAATAPDDKVLVAGMHSAPKKKKGRANMTAALLSLAKDKKEKKKEKGEKASNLLVAAHVVRCHHATLKPILCIHAAVGTGTEVWHS